MKLLVLVVVVSVANIANAGLFGGFGNSPTNAAASLFGLGARGGQNQNLNPSQSAAEVATNTAASLFGLGARGVQNQNVNPSEGAAQVAIDTAASFFGLGGRGSQNQNVNPSQGAAQVAAVPVQAARLLFGTAAGAPQTPAASPAAVIIQPPAPPVSRVVAVSPPRPVAPPAPLAPPAPVTVVVAPSAPVAPPAPKVVSIAETTATVNANSAYGSPVNYQTVPVISQTTTADGNNEIIFYENDVRYNRYHYKYDTTNGISVESYGDLKDVNGTEVLVLRGYYQYIDTEGNPVLVTYTADEQGFHPESEIIPTPPPIPEAIAEAIAYILSVSPANAENGAQ